MDSYGVVEAQVDHLASQFGDVLNADVISLFGPMAFGIDSHVRDAVQNLTNGAHRDSIAVVLETTGGSIEVVERIANTLRHHYPKHVEFVVPNFAYSAGTVLTMSGDVIRMDYFSVLGPIDPQLPREGRMIPALGYLAKYEQLLARAKSGKITTAETAILLNFDQAELYQFEQAREHSTALLKEWLVKYKFKNWKKTATRKISVTSAMKKLRANNIAKELNRHDKWHSHGRGISMEVLRNDLKLVIDDFGQNAPLNASLRAYYNLLSDYVKKCGYRGIVHSRGCFLPI